MHSFLLHIGVELLGHKGYVYFALIDTANSFLKWLYRFAITIWEFQSLHILISTWLFSLFNCSLSAWFLGFLFFFNLLGTLLLHNIEIGNYFGEELTCRFVLTFLCFLLLYGISPSSLSHIGCPKVQPVQEDFCFLLGLCFPKTRMDKRPQGQSLVGCGVHTFPSMDYYPLPFWQLLYKAVQPL